MLLQAQQPNSTEGAIPSYRAYEIGEDGKVKSVKEVFAVSDDDAVAELRSFPAGRKWELWDRDRVVVRLSLDER